MRLDHARILVLGLGVSGESAARLCASYGASVTVTDSRPRKELAAPLRRLAHLPVAYRLGADPPSCAPFALIIRSPGVPRELPVLADARLRGVPVWSEIQLGAAISPCPISVAITGTNGKTTTTILTGELMRAAGRTVHVVGNIGDPFTAAVPAMASSDTTVVEVSSAQLENCHTFAPRIAVLTNIRPEHMDHYTWEQYVAAKRRIVRNHTPAHSTVANYDDELCREIADSAPGKTVLFSARAPLPPGRDGVYCEDGQLVARMDGARTVICQRRELRVPGALPNLLAMIAVGLLEGIGVPVIRDVATGYSGREHVIEYVASRADVDFYNDSKATNPWSTAHALDALSDRPIVLIVGGKDDKEADFTPLVAALPGRVRHLITMGQTGPRIAVAARAHGMTAITEAANLAEAVGRAADAAQPGDAVLFSPGANSRDMFPDHRIRGELFKQQALRLPAPADELSLAGR